MPRATSPAPSTFPLARFVEAVHTLVPVDGRASHEQLPDGRTMLVFRVLEEGRRGDVSVVGPRTRARFKSDSQLVRAVILPFKPGWSTPLLGVAASELTDQIVPLHDIWPGTDLCSELLAARTVPEVLARISQALALRTRQTFEPASARLARRAAHLLDHDEARVETVAEQLGVTSRHLRRAFTESIGVAPRDFARHLRLQRAVRLAATSQDWGRIAAAAGYYDQAHLIADFQKLVGLTPVAFQRRGVGRVAAAR